jgi:hypothetical protein
MHCGRMTVVGQTLCGFSASGPTVVCCYPNNDLVLPIGFPDLESGHTN